MEGQTEGGGRFERHCGQAEKRPRQYAQRGYGKRDALFCPQSKQSVIYLLHTLSVMTHLIVAVIYLCVFFEFSQKQMTYLETQQNDAQAAKEEARRLRTKMKTFERYLRSYNYCHVKAFEIRSQYESQC